MKKDPEIVQLLQDYFAKQQLLYGDSLLLNHEILSGNPESSAPAQKEIKQDAAVKKPKKTGPIYDFYYEIRECQQCALGATRTHFVFGAGNPTADLMFVGEAPGRDEDLQGVPFVGRAGQLLTLMLQAINLERNDVFIANVLKCRPPNNRDPLPDEVAKCEPYLLKQIEIIKPKLIVTLGRFAASSLLRTKVALGTLRQEMHQYNEVPLIVTYHPAALLRNPSLKRNAWEDLKKIRAVLTGGTQ